jgi:membrane dipeptidase
MGQRMTKSTQILLGAALGVAALAFAAGRSSADDISQRAQRLLKRAIVLDTHDDTPQRMIYENFDLAARDARGHIDIPRMREGGLNGIFFSIWTPGTVPQLESVQVALRQIDAVREQARRHPNELVLATTAADIRAARAQGKIATLMGVEGGHMIADDLAILRIYATLGVRYITLTHSVNDDWADSSTDKPAHNGLTSFGKDVVREMNRLGMMVDISHVSDKTFYDVLEITRAPMIASHSSCRAICNVPRNMSDDMIRALAKNGGVININYHIGFLSQEYADASKSSKEASKPLEDQLAAECGKNQACLIRGGTRINQQLTAAGKLPPVSWEKIIEHIAHVVKLVGPNHVGLGSDFDGAIMPQGMEDVSHLPRIAEALLRKGYSEADVERILGGNLLRVMEQVEKVSREAPATK